LALKDLNDKQLEAVKQIDGPLLILAGAGSGKTSTMTNRIAYMVSKGIDPYNILAVTFTNKAAQEMRDRVEALIGPQRGMWIMTFHAMCLRILHADAEKIGYKPNFVIYDTSDQKTLVKNIMKEKNISDKEFQPQFILSAISKCKESGRKPSDLHQEEMHDARSKAVAIVYTEYQKRLKANNAMDFDDLLVNTVELFRENKDVLAKYQERFKYIMVDEYQDTNHTQYMLITMLAARHHNLCVVGDDDQCIYEWRGADIRNILDFEKDFRETKIIKLEQNYRSKGNILAAAHSVIKNNRSRKPKELWTEKDSGEKITYFRVESDKDEAGHIASLIESMVQKGRAYNDFAVLYRTNAQSRLFEECFSRMGIPYRVLSGMRYYDRKEVKDVIAYMRLIVNPSDDLSLLRVINEPKRGVGQKTIEKLRAFATVRGQSLLEALSDPDGVLLSSLSAKACKAVSEMINCIVYLRNNKDRMSVADIYDTLLENTGYLKMLEDSGTVESESRVENLMEFKSVIADYEKDAETPTIEDFMAQMTLAAEVDNYDEGLSTVTLMTLHSAKGLEFPVVFMPGMEDGLFPGSKAFDSTADMEQERRLCYVGMTRAKELLFMSSAEIRTRYGRTEYTRESQFMREIDKDLLKGDAVFEKKAQAAGPGAGTGSFDGFSGSSYKPFDSLGYARQETKAHHVSRSGMSAASQGQTFTPGDKIEHPKFGQGMVIEDKGNIVTVAFDSVGIKKLAKGIAVIKKIG
jgi:DNA helicase-2/ATP-dependent DNA helicase PcrA